MLSVLVAFTTSKKAVKIVIRLGVAYLKVRGLVIGLKEFPPCKVNTSEPTLPLCQNLMTRSAIALMMTIELIASGITLKIGATLKKLENP